MSGTDLSAPPNPPSTSQPCRNSMPTAKAPDGTEIYFETRGDTTRPTVFMGPHFYASFRNDLIEGFEDPTQAWIDGLEEDFHLLLARLACRTDRLSAFVCGGFPPLNAPFARMVEITVDMAENPPVGWPDLGDEVRYQAVGFYRPLLDWPEREEVARLKGKNHLAAIAPEVALPIVRRFFREVLT